MTASRGTQSAAPARSIRTLRTALAALVVLLPLFASAAPVIARHAALSTASPLATRAGLAILQRGGTAADAAVAVAFTLAVTHPQSGCLGGGGFLVYYDAKTRAVWTLDFREIAPRSTTRDMLAKGALAGARSAGVPGAVAGLGALHEKFGSLAWKELLAPSVALANEGPRKDAVLDAAIAAANRDRKLEIAASYPPPELAATLQRIADDGARALYTGDLSKKLVDAVQRAGGSIGFRDLRTYEPVWRGAIKLRYGPYEIYTVAPPSGGGLVLGETLDILGADDLAASGFQSVKTLHLVAEAERRALIDRDLYVSDPVGSRIPYRDLLSHERAEQWRESIDPNRVTATSMLTEPRAVSIEKEHTTHFTIADANGNVAAVTTSLGGDFGSGFLVAPLGFYLNDALNDFTTGPNAPDPGKRPASSMSPVIVLRDTKPFLALGTPGGSTIPTTILQVFLNVVVHGLSLQDAVAAPRYHQEATPDELLYEPSLAPQPTLRGLNEMGHGIAARHPGGDVHAILFENDRLIAVSDPRGSGAAGGY